MLNEPKHKEVLRPSAGLERTPQLSQQDFSRPLFDIASTLTPWLEQVNQGIIDSTNSAVIRMAEQINQRLIDSVCSTSLQIAVQTNQVLERLIASISMTTLDSIAASMRAMAPWLEELAERERVRAAFYAAGFIPSPSMNTELVRRVVDAHEKGVSASELANMILSFFDEDRCERLIPVVDRLCENPEFESWRTTLEHVLAAHRSQLDSITTYPVVAMIEGILLPFFTENFDPDDIKMMTGTGKVKHNTIAKLMGQLPLGVVFPVGFEAFACLIDYFEEHLYQSSDWKADKSVRSDYVNLNRHRLLHGMVTQGTRMNTLRCLFILDLLGIFLPAIRAELDEEVDD